VIGVMGADGRLEYLRDRLEIDQAFIDEVSVDARPEQRFRFSGPCVEHGCEQWDGCRCTVIDRVMAQVEPPGGEPSLQPCAIRTACRWFDQTGPDACRVCPMVITDSRGPEAA
jgi:hypothetical protein